MARPMTPILILFPIAVQMVVNYFRHKYPRTSFWLVGHSLGGSIASLAGMRFHLPTVTFEAPGERLAALRLGLVSSPEDATSLDYITHVYNNLDPLPWGSCKGPLSLCAQAGYAMESKCHAGRVAVYLYKGPGWTHPLIAHQLESVIAMLENENVPVPRAVPQRNCEVIAPTFCTTSIFFSLFAPHRIAHLGNSETIQFQQDRGGGDC
jgi:lipase ATG15